MPTLVCILGVEHMSSCLAMLAHYSQQAHYTLSHLPSSWISHLLDRHSNFLFHMWVISSRFQLQTSPGSSEDSACITRSLSGVEMAGHLTVAESKWAFSRTPDESHALQDWSSLGISSCLFPRRDEFIHPWAVNEEAGPVLFSVLDVRAIFPSHEVVLLFMQSHKTQ